MHKIGIDARLLGQTGVGVYLLNLLYYLERIVKDESLFYVYVLDENYDKIQFKNKLFIKKAVTYRWHTFAEQIGFARILFQDNLDLVHFTYFSYPVLYRKKFVATVHDVTPLLFKTGKASTKNRLLYEIKQKTFKFVISQQVKNASAIIVPTKTVKKQLTEIFGKSTEKKIIPIYEGVDYELIQTAQRHPELVSGSETRFRNEFGMTEGKPFFIYVGNFYPHKNVERLILAISKIGQDVKLVLVGPDDFFAKRLLQLINKLKLQSKIFFFHNPTKEDLVFFYKNALALIHPSLSEGFGLSLIESAYFNLPMIASNIPVFKEILDDRYISFDPKNPEDIASKIKKFLLEKNKFDYSKIIHKFSFEKMTKEISRLYNKILFK